MQQAPATKPLPDGPARLTALTEHDRTLLVEAGAGSGKTALMAGRVALLLAAAIHPKDIVAITFTEAAASELLERTERVVRALIDGRIPVDLREALPHGITAAQRTNLEDGARALGELTCTTIHGFCQQLVRPYPVEARIDPGAAIVDPSAAELAYQDLMEAWLSARFGRDRGAEGLGRIPPMTGAGGEDDLFTELLLRASDSTLALIDKTARFLKRHRTAQGVAAATDAPGFAHLAEAVTGFTAWYRGCGVVEPTTDALIQDLTRVVADAREAAVRPLSGRHIADLLFHTPPQACKKQDITFKQWGRKGKWKDAAKVAGRSTAQGEQLSAAGEAHYRACGAAYQHFRRDLGALAFQRFVTEFDTLKALYRDYKQQAALLDFDDLLHHARDLLKANEPVRRALAARYPRILVDEFQDTDPLQAEILWRLAGEGAVALPWQERAIRPGALFLVGDPKQAIYRFRGADVETYLIAKRALAAHDPTAVLGISANFRSQDLILDFVNSHFAAALDESTGQPGFTALSAVRVHGDEPSVAAFEIALDERHRNSQGKLVVDRVRREEATVVADLARHLIGAYPVWDKEVAAFRLARARDIALLAPTGTQLWIYERALEAHDISIATQAGKGFFRRQEVQDLIAVVRAIADRRNTLALGAVLRGPLVGLTEEEIADEIHALQQVTNQARPLYIWTDSALICLGAQLAISVNNCPPPRDPRSRMTSFKRTQRKYVQKAYRVRNWREYETGLRARGSLTVWLGLTDGKLANWNSPRPTRRKPGRQRKYSNHAIETTVTLGLVFGLASRQTEGFLRSLLTLLNLDNDVPDHSTISRRKARLGKGASYERRTVKPVHLRIDSSGLSVHVGQLRTPPKARDYRKLHLAVDEHTSDVVACELTSKRARDASRVASLVGQIERPIASAKADAAYDTGDV